MLRFPPSNRRVEIQQKEILKRKHIQRCLVGWAVLLQPLWYYQIDSRSLHRVQIVDIFSPIVATKNLIAEVYASSLMPEVRFMRTEAMTQCELLDAAEVLQQANYLNWSTAETSP